MAETTETQAATSITDEELIRMAVDLRMPRPSDLWRKAFNLYNAVPSHTHVGMGCHPCFYKVFTYLLSIRLSNK